MNKPRYNKVYVLAPYAHHTGGVELAHQLVSYINGNGGEAYIVYEQGQRIVADAQVTPQYADYNIKVAGEIEDLPGNMLVLPEVYFDWMYRFDRMDYGLWWMSVDNHFKSCYWLDSLRFYRPLRTRFMQSWLNFKYHRRNSLESMRRYGRRIIHFYQSAYARDFLRRAGMSRIYPLSDYINPATYSSSDDISGSRREDIVLYNPAKGLEFTRKLIDANSDIKFVPLKGLSRQQLNDYMRRAKLYIDFGHFPGKDRLPREAVMNGMCIITGRAGASGFFEDVAIGDEYKFEARRGNIPAISQCIRSVLADFDKHSPEFDTYRRRIDGEKSEFEKEIRESFFIPSHSPRLLVVIVTYNGMKWLSRCLQSVMDSSYPADVYIVDNGSTDGSIDYCRRFVHDFFDDKSIVRQMSCNVGFGAANNIALRYALEKGYEWVYLLNQDAWVEPDTFDKLIGASVGNPEYGVLSPLQITADRTRLDSNFALCVPAEIAFRYPSTPMSPSVVPVRHVMAAHWLVTRRCLETVGLFSPTFFHYGEDSNYIDRLHYHGMKAGIVPSAVAIHDRADRLATLASQRRDFLSYGLIYLSNPNSRMRYGRWSLHLLTTLVKSPYRITFGALKATLGSLSSINRNLGITRRGGAFIG